MKNWASLYDVFDCLNAKCNYIVLRNYDSLFEAFNFENDDIDLLCDNKGLLVKTLEAKRRDKNTSHYKICVRGYDCKIDIRYVGDGYYCTEWERKMISKRMLYSIHGGGVYIMDSENYFYSVLYHCLVHKGFIADKYLNEFAVFRTSKNKEKFYSLLLEFLNAKCYKVTNSSDSAITLHFDGIPRDLIYKKAFWEVKRFCYRIQNLIYEKYK